MGVSGSGMGVGVRSSGSRSGSGSEIEWECMGAYSLLKNIGFMVYGLGVFRVLGF